MADDYTPATDLVFSMLALTLLLLAIFGAGSHVTENRSRETIGDLTGDKVDLAAALDRANSRIGALEAQVAATPPPAPGSVEFRLAQTMRDRDVLQRQYDDKTRQYETVMDDLARTRALAKGEIRLSPITAEAVGDFFGPDDRITRPVVDAVIRGLKATRADVVERRSNEIAIQVETGNMTGKATPKGPDDEMVETFSIGAALQRELWATPLPPACVVVEPIGRIRASGLVERLAAPGAGALIEAFVGSGRSLDGAELQARLRPLLQKDKRIFIVVRRAEKSPCSSEALSEAISRL